MSIMKRLLYVLTIAICAVLIWELGNSIYRRMPKPEVLSADGQYALERIQTQNGERIMFSVTKSKDTWYNIYYSTPSYFSGHFSVNGLWANEGYDFFVLSSDTGLHIYRNENESWIEYHLAPDNETSREKSSDSVTIRSINTGEEISYDTALAPLEVQEYIEKTIEN